MALLKGLVRALLERGEIRTTEARAKEVRSIAEKVITVAKTNDLHSRRLARRVLDDEDLVKVLFDTIAPQFAEKPGGRLAVHLAGRADLGEHRPGNVEDLEQLVVPVERVNIEDQGAAGVAVVGHVPPAAGEPPDEPGVDGAEEDFTFLGASA